MNRKIILDEYCESASAGYLMQLTVFLVGLPIPFVNLLGGVLFYLAKRKSSHFVKWHATQALVSQLPLYALNTVLFWWTLSILFTYTMLSSAYFAFLFTLIVFNLFDYIYTIYTAIQVRKGVHIKWYVYGILTDMICKPYEEETVD